MALLWGELGQHAVPKTCRAYLPRQPWLGGGSGAVAVGSHVHCCLVGGLGTISAQNQLPRTTDPQVTAPHRPRTPNLDKSQVLKYRRPRIYQAIGLGPASAASQMTLVSEEAV